MKIARCLIASLMYVTILNAPAVTADSNPYLGLPEHAAALRGGADESAVRLGEKLFFDTRLSSDGTVSCASCHQPDKAFSDGRAVAQGVKGRRGTRNTPSLLNVGFAASLFWDGRRSSLESQALDPFVHPSEHGLIDHDQLLGILRTDASYISAFSETFGGNRAHITVEEVSKALASFQRTLMAADSPFDRYMYKREPGTLSPAAVRGLSLFRGSAGCHECHPIGEHSALFTDESFHLSPVALRKLVDLDLSQLTVNAVAPSPRKLDTASMDADTAALGRYNVTRDPADIGKFRTPSLRNVAATAPYMHDGSVGTLVEAAELELYNRPGGRRIVITPSERSDIVAFLQALTSP